MTPSSAEAIAIKNFRVKGTGAAYPVGSRVEAPAETLRKWADMGLVQIEEPSFSSRLFSNGKPTGATIGDQPHIRVYAWSLVNLRFGPALSSPTDLWGAAEECQLSIGETREAFRKLLRDGDLLVERGRGGRDVYYLAPLRW